MKTLLLTLLLPAACLQAVEPAPKLVPRPIPGLTLPTATEPPPIISSVKPSIPQTVVVPASTNPDQARVLYIHRRATLPVELTRDLPVAAPQKVSSSNVQVRQGSVKIIPKNQVANLLQPAH